MAIWQGRDFELSARLIPRIFWMTASIDVYLDGECVLRTGGVMKLSGENKAIFQHAGENHEVELAWESGSSGFSCNLSVDGSLIETSVIRARNSYMQMIPGLTALALAILYMAFAK